MRIVGISLIFSGAFLYFYSAPKSDARLQEENAVLHSQVTDLETKLEKTEEELAHLQTLTSEAKEDEKEEKPVKESKPDQQKPEKEKPIEKDEITKFTLTIELGTTSKDVASTLEKAKIIDDAKEFNDYLKAKKLTKSIQIGDHEIDSSMSIETISKMITTRPDE